MKLSNVDGFAIVHADQYFYDFPHFKAVVNVLAFAAAAQDALELHVGEVMRGERLFGTEHLADLIDR